jgi:hypothetical protein
MKYPRVIGGYVVLFLGLCRPTIATDSSSTALVVTPDGDHITMFVPASRIAVSLPRGNLELDTGPRTGSAASPRYFRFNDPKGGIIVSGWFESANQFGGFEQFWNSEFQSMKKSGVPLKGAPEVVRVGPWIAAAYDVDVGKLNGANTHMRSELIEAGTWVDLHISVTKDGSIEDARNVALEFLKGVVVSERQ